MFGCVAFLIGLALVQVGASLDSTWIFLAIILVVAFYRKKNLITIGCIVLLGLSLGLVRGENFKVNTETYEQLYGKKITLVGVAQSDGIYSKKGQLMFDLGQLSVLRPEEQELVGKIGVQGYGEKAVYKGDVVQIEGKLYKTRGSKQAGISFADINVIQVGNSPVEKLRREFVAGMYSALPEPQGSFGLGLLVGQRSTLPEDVSNALKIVGLTHIVAVSGYNLTILVRAAQRLFGKRSKYQATLVSVSLIISFLAVTGMSASIVRASIVSALSLTAWYFGRHIRPTLLIAITAALTAGWYPLYLWSDIGWYLSFLAFFGVLVLAPLIAIRIWGKREPSVFMLLVIESICAQIMTAPLILYIFHQTSMVGLIANILVVPLVPFAMLFGAIAGTAGMIAPALAGFIAWPAKYLLLYMLDIANALSRVPHAQIERSLSLAGLVFCYVILAFITLVLYRRAKSTHGIIRRNYLE